MNRIKKIIKVIVYIFVALLIIINGTILGMKMLGKQPSILGYHIYYIASGSMEPTIKLMTGFIYDKVDIEDVKKDDIIVYNWTDENGAFLASPNGNVRVIHRVVKITKDDNGNVSLITRGDNKLEDDKHQYCNMFWYYSIYKVSNQKSISMMFFDLKQ